MHSNLHRKPRKRRTEWLNALLGRGGPWRELVERDRGFWERAVRGARGPRVLLATSMGGYHIGTTVESALAVALTLRGARVEVLLCDRFLPACQLTKHADLPPARFLASRPMPRCDSCESQGRAVFEPLRLPIHWYSQLVSRRKAHQARRDAATLPLAQINVRHRPGGLAVGEHALAGALRYYARGDFEGEPESEAVRRRYLEAAHLSVAALDRLLRQRLFDVACFHHGLYVPQGLVVEACRRHGVRSVTWNAAYRKQTFIFSHGETYHHTMLSEPAADWEGLAWTPEREAQTLDYLSSRRQGTRDWIWFHERPEEDVGQISQELGLDPSKPWIGLLTNVMWDAVLHYPSNAFPNMLDWVHRTIAYFAHRPELQLVIRVHPAEVRGLVPARQLLVPEIRRAFPQLPPNVFVIPPESRVSTYALMERCDSVLIYNTKTGIELASLGIPVIVAGEAWIRGKGFALDARSPEEYFALLERLPLGERLSPDQVERARKYAHHFFFRRMVPLPFVTGRPGMGFELDLHRLADLGPGRYPGLDTICAGILRGEPFIHEEPKRMVNAA